MVAIGRPVLRSIATAGMHVWKSKLIRWLYLLPVGMMLLPAVDIRRRPRVCTAAGLSWPPAGDTAPLPGTSPHVRLCEPAVGGVTFNRRVDRPSRAWPCWVASRRRGSHATSGERERTGSEGGRRDTRGRRLVSKERLGKDSLQAARMALACRMGS